MAIKKETISSFLELGKQHIILDVRSPGEFNHAHIPGAYSLPLFTDEERKIVGTAYKQQGKQKAIKLGLDFFGVKMKQMVEDTEAIIQKTQNNSNGEHATLLVHCWRGGMRSAGVAWLLDLYGYRVHTLVGGYKAFRKWVLMQFENDYNIQLLGGYTGSGKTDMLQQMRLQNQPVIDLEALAHHKGSAFGGIGQEPQPMQEMFENKLAQELAVMQDTCFWVEDESQRIGVLNIPHSLWRTMRQKPVYFIELPFEERLQYIVEAYASLEKEKLVNAVIRIQKRLGPMETKTSIGHLIEDNYTEAFRILLSYYDKTYLKGLHSRENTNLLLHTVQANEVNPIRNTEKILACTTQKV